MKVSEWIASHPNPPISVLPDEPMDEVAAVFLAHAGLRDLYVIASDARIQGFIRHRRLAQLLLAEHLPVQTSHQILERVSGGLAKDVMERDFVSASADEQLDNVLHRMLEYGVEDMPVVDRRCKALGNINLTDVLRAVLHGEI